MNLRLTITIFKEYNLIHNMTIGNPHTTFGGKEAVLIMLDKTALTDLVILSKIWLKMALIK